MKNSAAVFLCATLYSAAAASAANVPAAPAKKAAAVAAVGAAAVVVKPAKADAAERKNTAPAPANEPFSDPYQTPLLLNAKPLKVSQP